MKPVFYRLATAISLVIPVFCLVTATAQERNTHIWPVKLQKEYTKTYAVGSETIMLNNRYGQLTIEAWDKNEVKVEAHITVGAQSNEYATKVLDRISVVDEKKPETISFLTKLEDWSNDGDYNGGHEMRIDYLVHLPANAKLYAENNFGPITIGDYTGESRFVNKYGTLTAGKLGNCKAMTVEFGKASIESISNSELVFKYSKVDITKMAGVIKAKFDFCNSVDMNVDNGIQQLELKNSYTSLYMVTPKDFSADYDIVTNNARATSKYAAITEEPIAGANGKINTFSPNHRYTGTFGKSGGTKLSIQSSFGNVRLM